MFLEEISRSFRKHHIYFFRKCFFNPVSVRKSAKYHSLNTDSSYRFERGVDIDNVEYALKRAASLIVEHCNGEIISDIMDDYPSKFDEKILF